MKHEIETVGLPRQRVHLDLSVVEFAGLVALHYSSGGGNSMGLRGDIQEGLYAALSGLEPGWQEKVRAVAMDENSLAAGYAYDRVERGFRP